MRTHGAIVLAICTAALALAAGVVLVTDVPASPSRELRRQEFQSLVGGLGFGPTVDMARCPICFDPRFGYVCQSDLDPTPGGRRFCPHHASSVFFVPPVIPEDANEVP